MKFGLDRMNNMIRNIAAGTLRHRDSIIIGDNASGKSLFLKHFIKQVKQTQPIYFIDAVNRNFDAKKVSKAGKKAAYKTTILETRLQEDYFNLQDSFNFYGTLTERIEMIYRHYEEDLQQLFQKLTGDTFKIAIDSPLGEVDFGDGMGLLSSGYQALVRILLELLYYQDMVIGSLKEKNAWIVIDEIDEFLSPKFAAAILSFLQQEFPWANWLVSTHSCDLIACTENANLIVLDQGECEVLDGDDYLSVTDVQIIFDKLFGTRELEEDEIDCILRRLLNNRMNHAWTDSDETDLMKLSQGTLSASQQLILKQIREW